MNGNYPPGVTGSEPQITGEWPVDPHAPWERRQTFDGHWEVYHAGDEDLYIPVAGLFDFLSEPDAARLLLEKLNRPYPSRCCVDHNGLCTICGDVVTQAGSEDESGYVATVILRIVGDRPEGQEYRIFDEYFDRPYQDEPGQQASDLFRAV